MSQISNDTGELVRPEPLNKAIMTPASAGFGSPDPAVAPWTSSTDILTRRRQPTQKAKPSFLDSENDEPESQEPPRLSLTRNQPTQASGQVHDYSHSSRAATKVQEEKQGSDSPPQSRHRNFVPSTYWDDEALVGADEESLPPRTSDETSHLPRQESSKGSSFLTKARMKSAHLDMASEPQSADPLLDPPPQPRKRYIDTLFGDDSSEDAPYLPAETENDRPSMLDTGRKKGILPVSSTAPSVNLSVHDSPPTKMARAMRGISATVNNGTSANKVSTTQAKLVGRSRAKVRLPALDLEEDNYLDEVGDDPFHNSHIPPSRGCSPAAAPKAKSKSESKKQPVTRPSKPAPRQKRAGATRRQKAKPVSVVEDEDVGYHETNDMADDLELPNDDEDGDSITRQYMQLPSKSQTGMGDSKTKDVIVVTSGSSVYDTDEDYVDSQPQGNKARGTTKPQPGKGRSTRATLKAQKEANKMAKRSKTGAKENTNAVEDNAKAKAPTTQSGKKSAVNTLTAATKLVATKSVPKKRTSPTALPSAQSRDTANAAPLHQEPSIDGSKEHSAYTTSPVPIKQDKKNGMAGHDAATRHAPVVGGHGKEAVHSNIIRFSHDELQRDEELRSSPSARNCRTYHQDTGTSPQSTDPADFISKSVAPAQQSDVRYLGEKDDLQEDLPQLVTSMKTPSAHKAQTELVKSRTRRHEAVDSAVEFPTSLERTALRGFVAPVPRKRAVQNGGVFSRILEVRQEQEQVATLQYPSDNQSGQQEQCFTNNPTREAGTAQDKLISVNKFPAAKKLDDRDQGEVHLDISVSDESGEFFVVQSRQQTQMAHETAPSFQAKHIASFQDTWSKVPKKGNANSKRPAPQADLEQPRFSFDPRLEIRDSSQPVWSLGSHPRAISNVPEMSDVGRISKRPRLGALAFHAARVPAKPDFRDEVGVPVHGHSSDDVFGSRQIDDNMIIDPALVKRLRDKTYLHHDSPQPSGSPARNAQRSVAVETKTGRTHMHQGQRSAEGGDRPLQSIRFEPSHDDELRDRVGAPTGRDSAAKIGHPGHGHVQEIAAKEDTEHHDGLEDAMHRVVTVNVPGLYCLWSLSLTLF